MSGNHRVEAAIQRHLNSLLDVPSDPRSDMAFIVGDLNNVLIQHQRWSQALPRVKPFYAVKCNNDVAFLGVLAKLGLGFDCASLSEIKLILGLGVEPSRIIYSHPCKTISSLRYAATRGVSLTTFDNLDELEKVASTCPEMGLLLRIYAHDETAHISLAKKFGAPLDTTGELLQRAKDLGLEVQGVSFHVGTGASDPKAYIAAVRHSKQVFDLGQQIGFNMCILDVGGGFQDENLEIIAPRLERAIDVEFPDRAIQVVAEPGRFYARSFYTMVCKVISRRTHVSTSQTYRDQQQHHASSAKVDMLYQSDGVYGCFMNALCEGEIYQPTVIRAATGGPSTVRNSGTHLYSIWGPSCDSLDCINKQTYLDCEVKIGDWLKYNNMGAYTTACSTTFNGFSNEYEIIYVAPEISLDAYLPLSLQEEGTAPVMAALEFQPLELAELR